MVAGCVAAPPEPKQPAGTEKPVEKLVLRPAHFSDLPGWREDMLLQALPALKASCQQLTGGERRGESGIAGRASDWREGCRKISSISAQDEAGLRMILEQEFAPLLATNAGTETGLFTGYFEVALKGSRRASQKNPVPLYGRPNDLIMVDLGQFRDEFKGRQIAGRIEGNQLIPYPARRDIDNGALGNRAPILAWVSDPIDAFFLHVQGSGRVDLDEGGVLRIGYDAQNGRPYTAIGKQLIDRGALTRETVSMQSIRAWMAAHPNDAAALMAENPSYVFFRELKGPGPIGAEGVALTPGRSLAVDRAYIPLGLPLWLDAMQPNPDPAGPDLRLQRLMVAQDTGGAIRGAVRGDVFWGYGAVAAEVSGRMKHQGRYWLLLPKALAARALATS